MQFVLASTDRYWWPVTVHIPSRDNAGELVEQKLEILFEPQDQDEAIEAQEAAEKLLTPKERVEHERQQLYTSCKDWRDVVDADKQPIPFTEENFRAALQKSWFRIGLWKAYRDSLNGDAARLGN